MAGFSRKSASKGILRRLFAFGSLAIMILVFSVTSSNFLTFKNIVTLLLSTSITGLLALAMTFVVISGGFDISVGTVMTVSGVVMGKAMLSLGLPTPLAILAGVAVGAVFGLANGLGVSRLKLQPFVATIGTMMIAKGLALVITGGNVLYLTEFEGFAKISAGSIIGAIIPGAKVPNAILIFIIVAILAHLVLRKTIFGHYIYAIGSNEDAVNMSGIKAYKWVTAVYIVSGVLSGMAGVMMASRLVSAQPAVGTGYEMDALAAVVIGGTPLGGGEGSILNSVLGVLIMAILVNGLRMLSVDQAWQIILTGFIIIFTVYIDMRRRRI